MDLALYYPLSLIYYEAKYQKKMYHADQRTFAYFILKPSLI